jgi:hypothetical protein
MEKRFRIVMMNGEVFFIRARNGSDAMNKIVVQEKVSIVDIDICMEVRS